MAGNAEKQLQAQIEAIKAEARAEGYDAALRDMKEFLRSKGPLAVGELKFEPPPTDSKKRNVSRRGNNRKAIEKAYRAVAPTLFSPTEMQEYLREKMSLDIAYSSIRHAINQLVERGILEQPDPETKTWRLSATAARPTSPLDLAS